MKKVITFLFAKYLNGHVRPAELKIELASVTSLPI